MMPGEPRNPSDPYRGWDSFFWINHYHGPRTPGEDWVLAVLRRLYGSAQQTVYHMTQAQVIAHTVRMANAPRNAPSNAPGVFKLGLPDHETWSDDSGPSEESNASDYYPWASMSDDPNWEETQPGVYERESVPEGVAPLRIERVPREPPDVREYGRRFSADEAGDGPDQCCEPFRTWASQVRRGLSSTHDKEVQTCIEETCLSTERAEVRPSCDVCGTPCYVYRRCRFRRQKNVMHHGRCCWYNPGWWE